MRRLTQSHATKLPWPVRTRGVGALATALTLAVIVLSGPRPGVAQTIVNNAGLFGSVEFRADTLAALPQWTSAMRRIDEEREVIDACEGDMSTCPTMVMVWRTLIHSLDGRHPLHQLQRVNEFTNRAVPYRPDGPDDSVDRWSSPLDFFANAGDAEDFAIAKMVTLLELGFSAEQMRVVVVTDALRNRRHAVLTVEHADRVLVLDSLVDVVIGQEGLPHYVPRYSVTLTSRWMHLPAARFAGLLRD